MASIFFKRGALAAAFQVQPPQRPGGDVGVARLHFAAAGVAAIGRRNSNRVAAI